MAAMVVVDLAALVSVRFVKSLDMISLYVITNWILFMFKTLSRLHLLPLVHICLNGFLPSGKKCYSTYQSGPQFHPPPQQFASVMPPPAFQALPQLMRPSHQAPPHAYVMLSPHHALAQPMLASPSSFKTRFDKCSSKHTHINRSKYK